MRYQAGTLLFHTDGDPQVLAWLRTATFPLLAPDSRFTDPRIAEAVAWVLGKEKLTLERLRVAEAPRMLYFKHEERPVLVQPQKLVLGRVAPDELNRGYSKLNVAFTLSPGSYATLVVKPVPPLCRHRGRTRRARRHPCSRCPEPDRPNLSSL
jgi:tRNA pseudouridine13 synthase